jgi:hypothetical protein
MRIIISDSSCLIDLRKASLLAVFLRLPFEILIPNTLFEGELLSFTDDEKKTLLREGLGKSATDGNDPNRKASAVLIQTRFRLGPFSSRISPSI